MKGLNLNLSAWQTEKFLNLYSSLRRIKFLKNETLDFYLKQRGKKCLVKNKDSIKNEYFFYDKTLYISYLYPLDNQKLLEKLIFNFINSDLISFFPNKGVSEVKKEIIKVFESFSNLSNIASWSNICSGTIKNNKSFKSIDISLYKTGDNFLHLFIEVGLNKKIQTYIEELRKKDDEEIFQLRIQISFSKICWGSSTGIRNSFKKNIDSIYKELDNFFTTFFTSYISKTFASLSAFKVKNKEKTEKEITYDLNNLGFDLFSFAGEKTRISYNFKSLYPQINVLKQFDDINENNIEVHNSLSMTSDDISLMLYQFNFHCYLLRVKRNMHKIASLLRKNKSSLKEILKLSQEFYSYHHIFDNMKHEHGSSNWKSLFRDAMDFFESINHYSVDENKKIDFSNQILEGLNSEIKNVESLFSSYSSKINNYIQIKSIKSSYALAKTSCIVAIIAVLIATFIGIIQISANRESRIISEDNISTHAE